MLDLTVTQLRDMQRQRCFFGPDDEQPSWERFYSADPRFKLTMAVPNGMLQMHGSCVFRTFEPNFQELVFDDGVHVVRTDLRLARTTGQKLLSFGPLHTMEDWRNSKPRTKSRHRYRMNGLLGGGKPGCITYGNGAIRVWFETPDQELWSFERRDDFPDDLFNEILGTAKWLSPWYFTELP